MTQTQQGSSTRFPLLVAAVVVVGLALVAAVAVTLGGDAWNGDPTAAVVADGDALPAFTTEMPTVTDAATDPAVGLTAPELSGTGFDGAEGAIAADGRPKVVYFVAHWCTHCQDEVPLIQDLVDGGQVPDGLDLYLVSTAVTAERGNFPPGDWLWDEQVSVPILRDDADSSALTAYGGSAFPYAVYLDGDNMVLARSVGSLDGDRTVELWRSTAASGGGR